MKINTLKTIKKMFILLLNCFEHTGVIFKTNKKDYSKKCAVYETL